MSIGVNLRVTSYSNQGSRQYMEDMFSVAYQYTSDMKDLEFIYFGIFDGHGGSEAAAYAKNNLLNTIIKDDAFWSNNDDDVLRAIRNGYVKTHTEMWKELENWPRTSSGFQNTSGTTASIAFIMRGKIYTGHVGDSCIVLGYEKNKNRDWKAKPLTRDHKPESFEEKLRIEECGGKVINKSGVSRVVWNRPCIGYKGLIRRSTKIDEIPFLAVARSLGDFWSFNYDLNKFIVSPEPDVEVFNVDPSKHRCLIFGTDGLWNVLSADVAISIVHATEKHNSKMKFLKKEDWFNPSKNLVDEAILQWDKLRLRADNTTVITLMLDQPGPPDPQVLLIHKMQTVNVKCEDKNSSKCVDGNSQIFDRRSSGGCAISTINPDGLLKVPSNLASTSKLHPNTSIETPTIKINKVLRICAKMNNNNDDNNNSSSKINSQPTEKRSTRKRRRRIAKKQKSNENSMNNDKTSKFGNSDSENEQMPCDPWILTPAKSIKPEETKVDVVLRSSERIKVYRNTKKDSTPTEITKISKIKTVLTEPITRIVRSHKMKASKRFKKVASR